MDICIIGFNLNSMKSLKSNLSNSNILSVVHCHCIMILFLFSSAEIKFLLLQPQNDQFTSDKFSFLPLYIFYQGSGEKLLKPQLVISCVFTSFLLINLF